MLTLSPASSERRTLPLIGQPVVNPEFIGIGHLLQEKRRDRRRIDQQQRAVQNRVLLLEKEHIRTNKEIEQKEKSIAEILAIKRRLQQERRQKQQHEMERQDELNRLKMQSKLHRITHKEKKHEAVSFIKDTNKINYKQSKDEHLRREKYKRYQMKKDLIEKQQIAQFVIDAKEEGRDKVVQFKMDRNREHIEEYNARISKEEEKKNKKISLMNTLELKQNELLHKLEKSSQQHRRLSETLSKAHDLNVKELEQAIVTTDPRILKSGRSARMTSFTEDRIERNISKVSMSLNPKRSTDKLNLQQYKRKLQEITSTLKQSLTADSHGIDQEIRDSEQEQNQSKKKVHKRKRNKHSGRYKNYEMF